LHPEGWPSHRDHERRTVPLEGGRHCCRTWDAFFAIDVPALLEALIDVFAKFGDRLDGVLGKGDELEASIELFTLVRRERAKNCLARRSRIEAANLFANMNKK